jgi:hypothetical protein
LEIFFVTELAFLVVVAAFLAVVDALFFEVTVALTFEVVACGIASGKGARFSAMMD